MVNLYCTTDFVGIETGGGIVTAMESTALKEICKELEILDFRKIGNDPFESDKKALELIKGKKYKVAHFYSGCFKDTVAELVSNGTFVTYTVAAHDINDSKQEFELYGIPYDFPHLTDPKLLEQYTAGMRAANVVICPSKLSAKVMGSYGCKNITVIPHGYCSSTCKKMSKNFKVGYLGQIGPDKGLKYLLEAWKLVNLPDSSLLLAGRNSVDVLPMLRAFGGGNVEILGFVKSVSDFYSDCSIYCQPSVTEGFGIEVLEAMAHCRPVIVSDGVGAADLVKNGVTGFIVPRRNPQAIAEKIALLKNDQSLLFKMADAAYEHSINYNWSCVQRLYQDIWEKV